MNRCRSVCQFSNFQVLVVFPLCLKHIERKQKKIFTQTFQHRGELHSYYYLWEDRTTDVAATECIPIAPMLVS